MYALHCPTCGYNLTGLAENRCPEGGGVFELRQIPTHHVMFDLAWDVAKVAVAVGLQLGGFVQVATLLLAALRLLWIDSIIVETLVLTGLLVLGVLHSERLTHRLYRVSRQLRSCVPKLRAIYYDWAHPPQTGQPLTALTRLVSLGPSPEPPRTFAVASVGVLFVIHLFLAAAAWAISYEVTAAF